MIKILSDKANLFNAKKSVITDRRDKDVADRIGRLLLRNPVAANQLLRKYNVETGTATPDELSLALATAIAENDEQFNYELATILASPRYSNILDPASITALISGISAILGGGLGAAKAGIEKKALRDSINGEIRLSYMQSQEAEKARQAKMGLLILAFLGIIIMITILIIFKPFAKKQ